MTTLAPVGAGPRPEAGTPPADVQPHEVERSLKRGAFWALGSQVATQAIRIAGVVALARLLTPNAYGAAALAVTLASFSTIVGDLGYGTALVQASEASQRRASTACWAAIGAGVIGSTFVALGALPAAWILNEPEVAGLLMAGGLTLFLVALGSASNALLTRSMSFGVIQGATVAAWAVATACSIPAAALGAGAWALVLQQLLIAGVTSAVFIFAARWRPSLEFSREDFRSLTRFALPLTGGSVFFLLQGLVTGLLVGGLVGIDELGVWNLSMSLVVLPLSLLALPLARVIYAAFARMRDTKERMAEVWLSGFTLLAAAVLPVLFGLIAVAPDFIPLVFGSQWGAAVPVVQILSVLVMSRTLQTWNNSVMDAAGKPQVAMYMNAAVLIALPPCLWLGSGFGIEGAAVAWSFASLVCGEIPSFLLTTRELSLKRLRVLARLRGIVLASGALCIVAILARSALEHWGVEAELRLLVSVAVGAATYIACLTVFARPVALQPLDMARGVWGKLSAAIAR